MPKMQQQEITALLVADATIVEDTFYAYSADSASAYVRIGRYTYDAQFSRDAAGNISAHTQGNPVDFIFSDFR